MSLVFLDVETTSFHKSVRRPWEIALIKDGLMYKRNIKNVSLEGHDPKSLEVSGFWERYTPNTGKEESAVALDIYNLTAGSDLVGTATWFDAAVLEEMLERHNLKPQWNEVICIQKLVSDKVGKRVQGLKNCAQALGLDYDENGFHQAMYDAVVAKRIYEAIKYNVRKE